MPCMRQRRLAEIGSGSNFLELELELYLERYAKQ